MQRVRDEMRWPRFVDSLAACFKVYSDSRSSCQNLLGSIWLSLLLRLWVSGQGA